MIPLIIAYILNIIDYIFTAYWIYKFGIEIEKNPIGRWMFENNLAWVVKIIVLGVLFAIVGCLLYRYPKIAWVAYIPLVVYSLLVIYHIIIAIRVVIIMKG